MRPSPKSLGGIISRTSLPPNAKVLPSTLPTLNRARQPTVIDQLVARRTKALAEGRPYPSNLRLEEFKDTRQVWHGISRDMRNELKSLLKEQ